MAKAHITMDDALLVHELSSHVQPILRREKCERLLHLAETCTRIAYCCMSEARQNARAERARQQHFDDPYTTEMPLE